MSESERRKLEARLAELETKLAELEAEKAEFEARIKRAFASDADLIQSLMRLHKEKGSLSAEDLSAYFEEQRARTEMTAAGLKWLQELGLNPERLADLASKGPAAIPEAIEAALAELEK